MIIKYCPQCMGRPYTDNMQMSQCPRCGANLLSESTSAASLTGREKLGGGSAPAADFSNPFAPEFGSGSGSDPFGSDPGGGNGDNPFGNEPAGGNPENPFGDFPEQHTTFPVEPAAPQNDDWTKPATKKQGNVPAKQHSGPILPAFSRNAGSGNGIRGKVFQYSSTGKEDGRYRRFPWKKLLDALLYKQRFEDVLHRFYVRVEGEKDAFGNVTYRDVPVNVHGTIAGGMQIADNSIVEVEGKFCNGTLMAERVYIVNSGYRSQVKFQHSPRAIFYGLVAIAALVFMIAIGVGGDGAFFDNIGLFLESWLIIAIVLTVLYFISMFTLLGIVARLLGGKQRGFPLTGIAVISMLLAMVCSNSFGLGNVVGGAVSSVLGSVLPIVFFIVIIIVIFKMFF